MCSSWLAGDVLGRIDRTARIRSVPTPAGGDVDVLSIESLPLLIKAVGFLKYRTPGNTYLRGQHSLYDGTVKPSLLRGRKNLSGLGEGISTFITDSTGWACPHADHKLVECPEILKQPPRSTRWLISAGVPRYAAEPLLQHYGLRTRWLDVVDNLRVALWFACHTFVRAEEHIHVVRRNTADGGDEHVYIVTVGIPEAMIEIKPGLYRSPNVARVIDLRSAVPSFYLRPHAQHRLLIRPLGDVGELQLTALEVPLSRALEWLGSSVLLSPFGLYPPASVDTGYRRLLKRIKAIQVPPALGHIDIIGPGY
jgi:hypothetical protein